MLELQAEDLKANLEQRKREAEEQKRNQAARVTAWFAYHDKTLGLGENRH